MTLDQFIALLPLIALNCFLVMVIIRSVMLGRRGIRARVRDPQRSPAARVLEIASGILFWVWVWLVVEFTWPRMSMWMPYWLATQLIDSPPAKWIGAVFVIIPVLVYPFTLATMGNSWRMGIDRNAHDPSAAKSGKPPSTLITHGLFRFARNPIYVLVDMLFLGTFLIHGRTLLLVFAIGFACLIHLQVLREEKFLTERYGAEYEVYRRRVRRYGVI